MCALIAGCKTPAKNMKSIIKRLLFLSMAAIFGMVEVANAFYDPGLQRWINRDPIGEWGGPDLYSFIGNEPSDGADAFGFYKIDGNKIYVEPCEIVIAYGDQPGKSKPLEFVFPKGKTCAGGAVVCWPDLTNKKNPQANQIPNSPDH